MDNEILRAILEEALSLTASLPAGIQHIAFEKAFDVLLDERRAGAKRHRTVERGAARGRTSNGSLHKGGQQSRRAGPKFVLGQLLDSGYFASSRSLPEIQRHLRDSSGHAYGSNELSISLLRLIRDGRLNRQKNLAGQYEYQTETSGDQTDPNLRHAKNTRLLTDGKDR
jgi:hypothetical protein